MALSAALRSTEGWQSAARRHTLLRKDLRVLEEGRPGLSHWQDDALEPVLRHRSQSTDAVRRESLTTHASYGLEADMLPKQFGVGGCAPWRLRLVDFLRRFRDIRGWLSVPVHNDLSTRHRTSSLARPARRRLRRTRFAIVINKLQRQQIRTSYLFDTTLNVDDEMRLEADINRNVVPALRLELPEKALTRR